jgi:DNA-binding LacI/PurR family transcriptional regulator
MAGRRPGIKDVAERAGVSWKTVSNVVNDRPVVRPETRRRVLDAIAATGYVPNPAGQALRSGTSRTVALVLPELQNPYFARLAEMFQREGLRRGRTISIELMNRDPELERRYLEGRDSPYAEAVIVSPTELTPVHLARPDDAVPLVLLGERAADPTIPHVMIDNVAAGVDVMRHLVALGRRRVGFVGAPSDAGTSTGSRRFDGYRTALRFAGIAADPDLVRRGSRWNRDEGYGLTRELLADGARFDALVCANDLLAIGAGRALRERGLRIPEDVALVGFDDVPEAAWASPPLTSVAPDLEALVRTTLDLALDPDERDRDGAERLVPHRLVIRGSTGDPDERAPA